MSFAGTRLALRRVLGRIALRKPTMSRCVKQGSVGDFDIDLGALRRRGEGSTLVGNECDTNVAGGGGALHGSSLEGVMRTWIRLSHHTELEDLDTHIAIMHEGDHLKRKKMEN
jgi:hypothetical protein